MAVLSAASLKTTRIRANCAPAVCTRDCINLLRAERLDAEAMPAALREGSVVWGLGLSAWIVTEKNLQRSALYCDVITDRDLHLVLCTLDLLANKPESRYVLARTIDYLLDGQASASSKRCDTAALKVLLR
jgi:hypothetical protein